jgi:RNA polymerase sigma-70 factor (ECF subfamily)
MPDKEAFIEILKQHESLIYKITRVYAPVREDEQDLYQDIVYQLWKSFDSFRNESKISTWMYRVALNTSITHSYKKKKTGDQVPLDEILHNRPDSPDPVKEERIEILYAQIRKLSILEKGIILLHLEGKNYEEIAVITGFTETNVGTRLNRIKQKLISQIKNN